MNKREREVWIDATRRGLNSMADSLYQMELRRQSDTTIYKKSLREFLKKLKLYEDATRRHEELCRSEQSGI